MTLRAKRGADFNFCAANGDCIPHAAFIRSREAVWAAVKTIEKICKKKLCNILYLKVFAAVAKYARCKGKMGIRFTDIFRWFESGKFPTKPERLLRASEKGNAVSQFKLGISYHKGEGVPQDIHEAIRWFRLAARQGHSQAQFYLGRFHVSGEGTVKDIERAYAWFELATARGHKEAAEWQSVIKQKMTPEQILEGKWLAQEEN